MLGDPHRRVGGVGDERSVRVAEARREAIRKAHEACLQRAGKARLAHHRAHQPGDQQQHPEGPHELG